jgi:threonine/homoserine/homoserine lactone efflux protein
MSDMSTMSVFLFAALVLLLTPGPAVLYIVTRSLDQGRVAGLVSVLSIEVGNLMHVLAATFGLSALLLSSALAFAVVKYLGAAYLVYLGVRRLLARNEASPGEPAPRERQGLGRVFGQGVLVAALNPKTALFFLAFLPQFVDPARGAVPAQFLLLGCLFVGMAVVTDSLYALLAGTAGQWLSSARASHSLRLGRYLVGSVYIGLGITAALARAGQK